VGPPGIFRHRRAPKARAYRTRRVAARAPMPAEH